MKKIQSGLYFYKFKEFNLSSPFVMTIWAHSKGKVWSTDFYNQVMYLTSAAFLTDIRTPTVFDPSLRLILIEVMCELAQTPGDQSKDWNIRDYFQLPPPLHI